MSIYIPDWNQNKDGNGSPLRIDLPTAACLKPANTSSVTVFWFKTWTKSTGIAGGHACLYRVQGSGSGINDGSFRLLGNLQQCMLRFRQANADILNISPAIPANALKFNTVYMGLVAVRNGFVHIAFCEPGQAVAFRHSEANTSIYAADMGAIPQWSRLMGSASSTTKANFGRIEDFNFWLGTFPETASGVPDATLIAAIAAGTQDVATLHTLLGKKDDTAGTTDAAHQARYRMRNKAELSPAFGALGNLTLVGENPATGAGIHDGGPLRRFPLAPARTVHCVSQAVFATPGDSATATGQIKVEGGSYSGLPTISKMQVRLVHQDGTVVRDWIDLTTSVPSGGAGTWDAHAGFTGVPMQAGFIYRRFRAVDSGGAVLAECSGDGLSGVGFHLCGQGQSQWTQIGTASNAVTGVTAGANFVLVDQRGSEGIADIPGDPGEPPTAYDTWEYVLNGNASSWGCRDGWKAICSHINAIYPGVPVQLTNVGEGGTALSFYSDHQVPGTPGSLARRWIELKASMTVVQPYIQMHLGHSSAGNSTSDDQMVSVIAYSQAQFGTPLRYMHVPVPRLKAPGLDVVASLNESRRVLRQFCIDNPDLHWWMGSWSNIVTNLVDDPNDPTPNADPNGFEDNLGANPHPDPGPYGALRGGSMIGQALLMASRAVPDVPIGITAARIEGATAVIEFGAVNA